MKKIYNKKCKKEMPIIESRSCLRCGNIFKITALQKNKLYCDECRMIHKKEQYKSAEAVEKKRARMKVYYREVLKKAYKPKRHIIKCERCGKEFILGSGRPAKVCIECLRKSKLAAERAWADYRRDYSSDK